MFGVPIDGPANVLRDKHGVVKNVSVPESTLMKKHNAINYHAVREAAAARILHFGKYWWFEQQEMLEYLLSHNMVTELQELCQGSTSWD
jgi:hypothetical protein